MVMLKRLGSLVIIVLIGIFIVQNQVFLGQKVELRFFPWHASLVLGIWLVLAFLTGMLLYLAIDLPRDLGRKRELRRKNHEVARLQAEVDRLAAAQAPQGPADAGRRSQP